MSIVKHTLTSLPSEILLQISSSFDCLSDLLALQQTSRFNLTFINTHIFAIYSRISPELVLPHLPKLQILLALQDELYGFDHEKLFLKASGKEEIPELYLPRLIYLGSLTSHFLREWAKLLEREDGWDLLPFAHINPSPAERFRFETTFFDLWHIRTLAQIGNVQMDPPPSQKVLIEPPMPTNQRVLDFLDALVAVAVIRLDDMAQGFRRAWMMSRPGKKRVYYLKPDATDLWWVTAWWLVMGYHRPEKLQMMKAESLDRYSRAPKGYWSFLDHTQDIFQELGLTTEEIGTGDWNRGN